VVAAGQALRRRGLVTFGNGFAAEIDTFDEVSGQALLLTGLHPDGDDALSRLISALRQAAEQSSDDEERGRIRKRPTTSATCPETSTRASSLRCSPGVWASAYRRAGHQRAATSRRSNCARSKGL